MKTTDQQELIAAIQSIMPAVMHEWNTVKLPLFEALVEQSFEEYFEGRQTQEKTKLVAPILDSVFARLIKDSITGFEISEGRGQDYEFRNTPLESKITFNVGDCWTGNGYAKTPWHLLIRFEITEQGYLIKHFAMMTDLSQCLSKWTKPAATINYSALRFLAEDLDKLIPIVGSVSAQTRTGRPGKYVLPIMESLDV
jgi:hypothetical protein